MKQTVKIGEKTSRLVLSKETIASLRVRTSVNAGAKPILSIPVNGCVSQIPAMCTPPKSGNGACF